MTFYSLKPFMQHYFISSCFYGTSNKAALNSFKWIQRLLNHVHCIAYNFIQKAKEPIPNLIEIHNSSLRLILMNKRLYKINDVFELSLVVRKPAFCICENKDADQLHSNCAADQRHCLRLIDSTIPLLSKSEILSL